MASATPGGGAPGSAPGIRRSSIRLAASALFVGSSKRVMPPCSRRCRKSRRWFRRSDNDVLLGPSRRPRISICHPPRKDKRRIQPDSCFVIDLPKLCPPRIGEVPDVLGCRVPPRPSCATIRALRLLPGDAITQRRGDAARQSGENRSSQSWSTHRPEGLDFGPLREKG
jgi:hypothetical protein